MVSQSMLSGAGNFIGQKWGWFDSTLVEECAVCVLMRGCISAWPRRGKGDSKCHKGKVAWCFHMAKRQVRKVSLLLPMHCLGLSLKCENALWYEMHASLKGVTTSQWTPLPPNVTVPGTRLPEPKHNQGIYNQWHLIKCNLVQILHFTWGEIQQGLQRRCPNFQATLSVYHMCVHDGWLKFSIAMDSTATSLKIYQNDREAPWRPGLVDSSSLFVGSRNNLWNTGRGTQNAAVFQPMQKYFDIF